MTNNTNIMKPITLMREDFINNIVDLCNNSGLPFFAIEEVLKTLTQEIHMAAGKQLEQDKQRYQEQIKTQEQDTQQE